MFFTAAFFANGALDKALENETPYERMHRRNANLRMLRAVGARAFVHVEIYTQKLAANAWEVNFAVTARLVEHTVYTTRRRQG